MQASSTKPILAAELVLTSTYQKTIRFLDSTAPSYLLPKSSSLSWHQPLNQSQQRCSSRHKKWFPIAKPSSPWVDPNQKVLSRWMALQQQELPTRLLSPAGPRWWICDFGGSIAAHPKISFVITGMQVPRTGPTTTPNTILTPTMKSIKARMQVTGPWWVLNPIPRSPLPMSPWIFPCRFSLFLFPYISCVYHPAEHYFPHIVNVVARVCRSPDSQVWTDHPQI